LTKTHQMFTSPEEFSQLISVFRPLFTKSVFENVGQLLLGSILTIGKRTVCSVLRTLGKSEESTWSKYHKVLNRAKWSAHKCAQVLLSLIIEHFATSAKCLVFVIDETLERRWGNKIKARGIYRDAVRSSKSHFVKCSGLRWICVMILVRVSWAEKIWALPFLSVSAPSERYHRNKGKQHKKISDWARQLAFQLKRWLPDFKSFLVGDNTYAVLESLAARPVGVDWITRLRLDAALYDPVPARPKGKRGRNRLKGKRQATLLKKLDDPTTEWTEVVFSEWYNEKDKRMEITSGTALWYNSGKPVVPLRWVLIRDPEGILKPCGVLCTDLDLAPVEIVKHFVSRWQVEVTFEEVRAHLGVETQRQWADLSILRTTPSLLALFSIVTLWGNYLFEQQKLTIFRTAWYQKSKLTFSDVIASVRYRIWAFQNFYMSTKTPDMQKIKTDFLNHLCFMAARAA